MLCVFVVVCVISNQSTSKKLHVSNLSKLDACQKSSGRGDLERVSKLGQNLRKGVGNIGRGLHKIGVLATLCQQ